MATSVNEYAASEMRYWCRTGDYGGVGYSQPNRWSAYDHSSWAGWLTGPGEMDCSAGVAGAYNIAFHECGAGHSLFPRSTWTGSLPGESARRGFTDIGGTWTGSVPDGGFRPGDLLVADGHVAMAVRDRATASPPTIRSWRRLGSTPPVTSWAPTAPTAPPPTTPAVRPA